MLRSCSRLEDHVFDGFSIAFPLHWEIGSHGGVRHDQPHIQVGVVAVADLLNCPHHLEGHSINQEPAPYYWPAGEEYANEFAADDAHVIALEFVVPIQPAPLFNGLVTDVIELRL